MNAKQWIAAIAVVSSTSVFAQDSGPVPVDTAQETGQDAATFQPTSKIYDFFNDIKASNLKAKVEDFYAPTVEFEDPFIKTKGRADLLAYYEHMFDGMIEMVVEIKTEFQSGDETVAVWTMTVKHEGIAGGDPVVVDGTSHVKFENDKVVWHRDYFDGGALVYEHVPLLGSLVKFVKNKVSYK